jgi:hypothetical protein
VQRTLTIRYGRQQFFTPLRILQELLSAPHQVITSLKLKAGFASMEQKELSNISQH